MAKREIELLSIFLLVKTGCRTLFNGLGRSLENVPFFYICIQLSVVVQERTGKRMTVGLDPTSATLISSLQTQTNVITVKKQWQPTQERRPFETMK